MTAMQSLYQQTILDHAKRPHGFGLREFDDGKDEGHPDVAMGESHQVNPTCGDEVTLRVLLRDDADGAPGIADLVWDGKGCSISQASISVLHDLVVGRQVADAEQLGETFRALMAARGRGLDPQLEDQLEDGMAFVGVAKFPARIKCALLGWAALRDALAKASHA